MYKAHGRLCTTIKYDPIQLNVPGAWKTMYNYKSNQFNLGGFLRTTFIAMFVI